MAARLELVGKKGKSWEDTYGLLMIENMGKGNKSMLKKEKFIVDR